jgi:hypothetical protein
MNTRRTSYVMTVAVVSTLVLAPWHGAALSREAGLPPIPVHGPLSPEGRFIGTLTVEAVTVADEGLLLLTGVLDGTAIHRTGATTQVRRQTFTAPAVPMDVEPMTDVVLLKMAPIPLTSVGRQLTLAPIPLDIEAVPDESLLFSMLWN